MRVLEGLQPERVMYYFEEIAKIPHGSRHTQAISEWLAGFAKDHGLKYTRDSLGNVVIRKAASKDCETAPGVILQGHMDMVCEKDATSDLDMEKEGLRLVVTSEGDERIISAEGTTLGGDDGIAVAYMLAILESDTILHPELECVFTVDEEIGMLGAAGMDMSQLQGRSLLNIDSEDEGHLLAGCAGGCIVTIALPVEREDFPEGMPMKLTVEGLLGGHSGIEIDKGRANACILLGRILQDLYARYSDRDIRVSKVQGGTKDNAIPRQAEAHLLIKPDMAEKVRGFLKEEEKVIRSEYKDRDPDIRLQFSEEPKKGAGCFTQASGKNVIRLLRLVPNGIQKMSFVTPGLVETSLNLGILTTSGDTVSASSLVRSNVNSEKCEVVSRMEALADALGGSLTREGDYPAWEYRQESHLREVMCACYREQYGEDMVVETVHAGVECGLFADGVEGMDAVSFGPDLVDIHTPKERMYVASVDRTWRLILSVLKTLSGK